MEIDTLFLSGCGTKGNAFIGSLKALFEYKIINLEKLIRYVCCSGSSIIGLLLICNYSIDAIHKLSDQLNYDELIDLNDLNIFFDKLGFFSNYKIGKLINSIIFKKFKKEDITLKEFYDLTKKEYICKVYNLSDKKEEYFSYQNHPDMKISLLVQITTCIPFFFKPIQYKNKYYIDGGVLCIMPFIEKYKNYIGIYIHADSNKDINNMNSFEYITLINNCLTQKSKLIIDTNKEKRIIKIYTKILPCINFDVCKDDKSILIDNGYKQTIQHLKKFDILKKD